MRRYAYKEYGTEHYLFKGFSSGFFFSFESFGFFVMTANLDLIVNTRNLIDAPSYIKSFH